MKYILKGGTVVGGSVSQRADLLIDGEKIAAVGENLCAEGAQVVDVTGKLLFPGFIDAHTHFDLDVCNTTTADDFTSGTRSAICGGTTMVIDFACPNKGETLGYGLSLWHKKADGKSSCDYGFHMTIDDWNEGIRAEIPQMFEAGIPSFKMYMTYPAMMIGDQDLFSALLELKKYGGIAGVHCENAGVIDALIAQHKKDGKLAPASHPECRPNPLEAEAVAHLLRIAEVADVPVVIVHLSTKEALAEVMTARARGQKVYVETCPHYLLLDDSLYRQPEFIDSALRAAAPDEGGSGAFVEGACKRRDPDGLNRPLQLYAPPEGGRTGRFHEDPRRPARRGDARPAAVLRGRCEGAHHEGADVRAAGRESGEALRSLSAQGRASGGQRRRYRGLRSGGGYDDHSGKSALRRRLYAV